MESSTEGSQTERAEGKIIDVQHLMGYLQAVQDGRKRRGIRCLLKITRSEWGIENGLHYRRDVTFQENHTRMTDKRMGRVMAIINNLVISLINHQGFVNHAHARRVFNACPAKALALISGL